MVKVAGFKDPINCFEHFKPKKPVIVRSFPGATPDKDVKASVAKSANSGGT